MIIPFSLFVFSFVLLVRNSSLKIAKLFKIEIVHRKKIIAKFTENEQNLTHFKVLHFDRHTRLQYFSIYPHLRKSFIRQAAEQILVECLKSPKSSS